MEVVVEKQQLVFDGHALEYYAYYFKIWNENVDHRITVKKVLDQWASALESLGENRVVFLPYYLDDQMSKALKAELVGKDIRLVITRVDYDGWAFNLDDLSEFMSSSSYETPNERLYESEHPKHFGSYPSVDLVKALRRAQIAA